MTELDHDYMPRNPQGILCRIYAAGSHASAGGVVKCILDTLDENDAPNMYDVDVTSNYSITVKRKGLYVVTGSTWITAGTASSYSSCIISANGTTIKESTVPLAANGQGRLSGFKFHRLNVGDVLTLSTYGDNAHTQSGSSSHDTFMDITYVGS